MIDPGPEARNIDPTTRALETYIDASVEQLLQGTTGSPQNGLLFLSAWHEAMPALVHLDPVLDPVDSRVFAVLWIWAKQQGRGSTAFPSYDYLLDRANIQSRATVARSLAILRITRWVTLCRRVRDQGRNRGNIYALHDEPLALASTLYLDPGYMEFLQNAQCHHHEHVGKIARASLQSLRECIDEGEDVLAASPLSQADQRLEALATIAGQGSGHYFWLRQGALNAEGALNSDRVQKLNSVAPVQNLNSALCSSRYLYKKTTTTTDAGSTARAREEPARNRASSTRNPSLAMSNSCQDCISRVSSPRCDSPCWTSWPRKSCLRPKPSAVYATPSDSSLGCVRKRGQGGHRSRVRI